ncbi:MAG: class I SAM-dependent methyltransferase [Chromatiaceae bacterium]|nr:class I SAM-dependent methyltransferase [Chromatiaceae bacterium]
MGDFSTAWLALREPVDSRARSDRLLRSLLALLTAFNHPPGAEVAQPLRILDLGCGTGANLRYLAPRLGLEPDAGPWACQDWICVDRDRRLLADLTHRTADWARGRNLTAIVQGEGLIIQGAQGVPASGPHCRVRTLDRDLARGSESLLLGPGTLVVASALLDLVAADWLAGLLRACARSRSHLYLALTYDGRIDLSPDHPHDGTLIALVNAHQNRDKGLGGPALGPSAPARLAELAAGLGFALEAADSDWVLGPDEPELQSALVAGWAVAAREQVPAGPESRGLDEEICRWHERRQAHIAAGLLHIRVGHRDALLSPLREGSETSGARLARSRRRLR